MLAPMLIPENVEDMILPNLSGSLLATREKHRSKEISTLGCSVKQLIMSN